MPSAALVVRPPVVPSPPLLPLLPLLPLPPLGPRRLKRRRADAALQHVAGRRAAALRGGPARLVPPRASRNGRRRPGPRPTGAAPRAAPANSAGGTRRAFAFAERSPGRRDLSGDDHDRGGRAVPCRSALRGSPNPTSARALLAVAVESSAHGRAICWDRHVQWPGRSGHHGWCPGAGRFGRAFGQLAQGARRAAGAHAAKQHTPGRGVGARLGGDQRGVELLRSTLISG